MMKTSGFPIGIGMVLLALHGCTVGEGADRPDEAEARAPVHVDSIFPIEEEIRRFQATATKPNGLSGGAGSIEALVARFGAAVNERDPKGFRELLLTRAEFAWLYYPHTHYTRPPYELSPALVWFQMQNRSGRGVSRLLRWSEGRTLEVLGYRCEGEPEPMGELRLWAGCTVEVRQENGSGVAMRLFGPVIEHGGRFKLLSATNEL